MDIQPLQNRSWNGTPISRRTTDGYVNATTMCKANGKQWNDYWRTDRSTEYLEALSAETGISVSNLCLTTKGGAYQGTWVHPRVAVDIARWISAPFAVWMDGWFLEELQSRQASQVQPTPPGLSPQESLDLIERSMGLLERLGVMDERDHLQFGDMVRNVTARGAGGLLLPASPEDEEMTLSDAWLEVTGSPLPRSDYQKTGRLVAALYREEFDRKPPTRTQFVDGAPRQVKSYKRGWLVEAVRAIWSNVTA
jgi:hypothetical protein